MSEPIPEEQEEPFRLGEVSTIIVGHFFHDTYTAFVAPLLPLIIEKLSITFTQAGALTGIMSLPAVLNPFIGYAADKISVRYFVIFAPAVSASLIGLLGFVPSYGSMMLLFFLTGISVAAFHAPAPAFIARVSGKRVGLGMSLFMGAGELGRTLGPIIAVSAVGLWELEGIYRLIFIGWASSLILLWRFRSISAQGYLTKPAGLRGELPRFVRFFLPIFFVIVSRVFLMGCLTTFLPTFLHGEGMALERAGYMLALLEGAGVFGALSSGTISDHLGRRSTLLIAFIASAGLMILYLQVSGWLAILVLLLLGFASLSPQPVLLALVQDEMPENRAFANGVYLMMSFLTRSIVLVLVGAAGDLWGLRAVFYASGLLALLAVPAILALPKPAEVPA